MKKVLLAVAIMGASISAHADLTLKSSGDQWSAALQDLQNAYNEGVNSNNYARLTAVLSSRFSLTGSTTVADIVAAYQADPSSFSSASSLNAYLNSNSTGSTGNNGNSGNNGNPSSGNSSTEVTQADLATKVDQSTQTAVDQAQDTNISTAQTTADTAVGIGQDAKNTAVNAQSTADAANSRSENNATRLDSAEGAIRETNTQLEVTDARSINNAERLDGVEQTNANQDVAISNAQGTANTAVNDAYNAQQTADAGVAIGQDAKNTAVNAQNTADTALSLGQNNSNRLTDVENGKVDKTTYATDQASQAVVDTAQNTAISTKVDQSTYATDKAAQASTDKSQNKAISAAQSTANAGVALGVANTVSIAGLQSSKVDKSTYAADKATQVALDSSQNTQINAVQDVASAADERSQNNAVRLDSAEGAIRETNTQLAVTDARSINNATRLDGVESVNATQDTQISNNTSNISKNTASIAKNSTAISNETTARESADAVLDAKKVDKTTYTADKKTQATRDDAQDTAISSKLDTSYYEDQVAMQNQAMASESTSRRNAEAAMDSRISSNTSRIGNLENKTNSMQKDIAKNRKVASAGIAGAGALSQIPQVSQDSTFSVGAGVGGYDSEQAVAVGFSARINNNVVTKVGVSTNTQQEVLWGAGVGVEW